MPTDDQPRRPADEPTDDRPRRPADGPDRPGDARTRDAMARGAGPAPADEPVGDPVADPSETAGPDAPAGLPEDPAAFPMAPAAFATDEERARAAEDRCFAARLIMERLPFDRHLGIVVEEVTPEHALLRLPYRAAHVGDPFRPALHGGALAMLADTAGGTAVIAATRHLDRVSTLDMRVDYLRHARLADTLAEARIVRVGARAAVVRIHVYQDDPTEPDGRRHVCDSTAVYSVYRAES